ncbi:MAG: hypothetical protein UR89_C0030G0003 [Candidatus Roizmanbacteria bacterium GW2011_GWA2_35_8]|uniref:Uncharacterized protein n=1 Tax=Candidatus Roizmanbacteria bacterium GW2011_GWA2_35_8 TaxID=1618479 RepID=A0A0G0FFH2_9BACT|nr:MAG: hypothetical protein UR89_C0030G0003 [Candidatus Roizmanbacteria bacterium GW2011_GWA2_35_8]
MKNLLVGLLVIFAFVGGYFFSQKYNFKIEDRNTSVTIPTIAPTQSTNLVGNDLDEHGCKGSAGYSWCEGKQKCLRVWEEPCQTDEESIKLALVKRNSWNFEDIVVTISKNDGKFARGGVKEKSSETGGGMFLATKNNGEWQIIFDGNGSPDCLQLKTTYLFPSEMLIGVCD